MRLGRLQERWGERVFPGGTARGSGCKLDATLPPERIELREEISRWNGIPNPATGASASCALVGERPSWNGRTVARADQLQLIDAYPTQRYPAPTPDHSNANTSPIQAHPTGVVHWLLNAAHVDLQRSSPCSAALLQNYPPRMCMLGHKRNPGQHPPSTPALTPAPTRSRRSLACSNPTTHNPPSHEKWALRTQPPINPINPRTAAPRHTESHHPRLPAGWHVIWTS